MIFFIKSTLLLCLVCTLCNFVCPQRSLLHWKRDLEHRLKLYEGHRETIKRIISSSIISSELPRGLSNKPGPPTRPTFVTDNVRFTDLIVPNGSLHLEKHIARPTVKVMLNKTRGYIGSKMSDLYQIKSNLGEIIRRLEQSRHKFIYKGSRRWPNVERPLYHNTTRIRGRRVFRQVGHIHVINSPHIELDRINGTDVDQVLKETYMENSRFSLEDPQGRLFFEGTKTFWNTVFLHDLRSGCCDRLKPLHTNRMLLRTQPQEVSAPILLSSGGIQNIYPVSIRRLTSTRISNRDFSPLLRPGTLVSNPISNSVAATDVIKLQDYIEHPEIQKTVVFTGGISVDVATLSPSVDNRLGINVLGVSSVNNSGYLRFPLEHDNYLLQYPMFNGGDNQHISGSVEVDGEITFGSSIIPIESVNNVVDFAGFLANNVVRIDRPGSIRGPVKFGAASISYNYPSPVMQQNMIIPSNEIIHVASWLNVSGRINGMRWPQDQLVLPLHPSQILHIRGRRFLTGNVKFNNHLTVRGYVAGLKVPGDIIPLHIDDPYLDYGPNATTLLFADGIETDYLTVQSGQFDDINMRDVYGDEQSLIMKSMVAPQPDGSTLIRAPLRVQNLHLYGEHANEGLLNGLKPHKILELKMSLQDQQHYKEPTIYGRKTFLKQVEVTDCKFDTINDIYNWTNQLIRIDRPIAQTIYSRLAFMQPPTNLNDSYPSLPSQYPKELPVVHVDKLKVEYETENGNQASYARNWNFSPELYIINQALARSTANYTGDRYRVIQQVRLIPRGNEKRAGRINGIDLNDVVTLDQPFRFNDRYVLVGKVDVRGTIQADRIRSNYPIDRMDLMQFANYRVPLWTSSPSGLAPIRLSNVVLSGENRALYVQSPMVNGVMLSEFVNSSMSLTRPQIIDSKLIFKAPTNFEAMIRTQSSLNGIKHFNDFANQLQQAKYVFEDGLQCHAVVITANKT